MFGHSDGKGRAGRHTLPPPINGPAPSGLDGAPPNLGRGAGMGRRSGSKPESPRTGLNLAIQDTHYDPALAPRPYAVWPYTRRQASEGKDWEIAREHVRFMKKQQVSEEHGNSDVCHEKSSD
jgi:hypothetical protein